MEYFYCGNYPLRTCYPESWSVWQENDTLWYVQPDDPREGFWVRVDYSGLTPERFEQIAQYIAASSGSDENVIVSTGKVGRYPYGYYEFTYENVYGERWTECRYALYYNDSIAYLVNFEGRSELLDESIRARNFEIVKNFEMLPRYLPYEKKNSVVACRRGACRRRAVWRRAAGVSRTARRV